MKIYYPPLILQKLSSSFLHWRVDTKEREMFLTFDDGPTKGITPNILKVLEQYQAKATFFCNGKQARENPEILEIIKQSGHYLGNHTYSHLNGWKTSAKDYLGDVKRSEEIFQSSLFRPPYGRITLQQAKMLNNQYHIIMWSIMTYDYHPKVNPEQSLIKIRIKAVPGSIILMHDSEKAAGNVISILTGVLEYFSLLGFTFSSLEKVFPRKT